MTEILIKLMGGALIGLIVAVVFHPAWSASSYPSDPEVDSEGRYRVP